MSRREADTREPAPQQETPAATSSWQRAIKLAEEELARRHGQREDGSES
jgi:hypothetical protein